MRKVLAIVLVVTMLASLVAIGSFADPNDNLAAVIGTDGKTVKYLKAADLANVSLDDGQTLQIINNVTGDVTINVDGKNITVEAIEDFVINGKVVLQNSSSAITSAGVVTLKNLTVNYTSDDGRNHAIRIDADMEVKAEGLDVTITRNSGHSIVYGVHVSSDAKNVELTINSSSIKAVGNNAAALSVVASNEAEINNTVIAATKNAAVLVEDAGSGSIAFNGGSITTTTAAAITVETENGSKPAISLVDVALKSGAATTSLVVLDEASLYIEGATFESAPTGSRFRFIDADGNDIVLMSATFENAGSRSTKVVSQSANPDFFEFYLTKSEEEFPSKSTYFVNLYERKIAGSAAVATKDVADDEEINEIVSAAQNAIWTTREATADEAINVIVSTAFARIDALTELNAAIEGRTEEDVIELGSTAIADVKAVATSTTAAATIEDIKSTALAAIELLKAKYDAQYAVDAAAGTNDILQAYVDLVQEQIWNKNTVEEVKAVEKTILDAIELIKVKIAAVIELKDDRDENEDEAIVAIASAAIEAIKSSANSSAVAEILSQAIADIEFEVYTNDAQAAVNAEAEGETDAEIIAIAADAVANIEDAATKAEIDALKAEAIAAIKLIKAKIAAEAIIRGEIPAGTDARVVEIASNAIAEVWAKLGTDAVEEAKNAAIAAIKLGNAMVAAEAAVQAEVPADASAAVKEIESAAIADIWAAKTEAEVEDVKSTAIAAIRAQILAENPVTADTTVWLVVVAAVAVLGSAVVSKKVFF